MDVQGSGVGTEGAQPNSRALCSYTRHWETHNDTFVHTHKPLLLPTATQTHAGISGGRPHLQPSPVSAGVLGDDCTSLLQFTHHFTERLAPQPPSC